MDKYWFRVEVFEDGKKKDEVTGHNLLASSSSEAESEAERMASSDYPNCKLKAYVGRM